ncbi:paraquat-inducible protein A [Shewanella sp. Isolate11]|uniref:paraquat-inducible protein A n=1 Tax=Shewanella sp. Isolate11 TaxID=2908530 RepID=UPI001EFDDC13|nr:paraquat-inducible protein A [Shewanella sp. Isolate11]MCG9696490.1 paraquat-inducible protein A [Shewanella sp. Isolate11]
MKNLNKAVQGEQLGLTNCASCTNLCKIDQQVCPRCGQPISSRDHSSIQKSWALLLTAAILLFPANLYPITTMTSQGQIRQDTIFTGIKHLIHLDLLPIAIILFVASILVPMLKIFGLATYLLAISFKLPIPKRLLMAGYHIIEWIGRWSMLDLFVISITAALVNMGQLLDAKPAPAATAFALVILLTQLAAKVLDTRLLWDQLESQDDRN